MFLLWQENGFCSWGILDHNLKPHGVHWRPASLSLAYEAGPRRVLSNRAQRLFSSLFTPVVESVLSVGDTCYTAHADEQVHVNARTHLSLSFSPSIKIPNSSNKFSSPKFWFEGNVVGDILVTVPICSLDIC